MYNQKLNKLGLPQKFRGIEIKPLMLKDEEQYEFLGKTFTYNKNVYHPTFIKMSYIKFILSQFAEQTPDIHKKICDFLGFVTGKHVEINWEQNSIPPDQFLNHINITIMIGDFEKFENPNNPSEYIMIPTSDCMSLSEYEFDEIKNIILEQNGFNIKNIQEFDPKLEEALDFVYKGYNQATFEEQVFSYCAYMKMSIHEVMNTHTYYQFYKTMSRIQRLMQFELYKPLEVSGQISFKDKKQSIDDWLSHMPEKGRYDDIKINKQTFIDGNDIMKVSGQK